MIKQKLAIRIAIWLFAIAALFGVYQWYRGIGHDIDLPVQVDTNGFIAAIERKSEGSVAVIFRPDGTRVEAPGYKPGAEDKEIVWRPDGNRLFFSSDRIDGSFNIYRWNTERGVAERRSLGSRSQSNAAFGPKGYSGDLSKPLIIAGGFVLELDPKEGTANQILPPIQREIAQAGEEQTTADQFSTLYSRIGTSFKDARWGKDRKYIVAVMRREGGEVLVIQPTGTVKAEDGSEKQAPPVLIEAGDKVEIDVAPNGFVVAAITGYQFPNPNDIPEQFIRDNRVVPPFRHAMVLVDPDSLSNGGTSQPLYLSKDDALCLQQPRFSPDGSKVLAVGGSVQDGTNFVPKALISMPAVQNGFENQAALVLGEVRDPAWHPQGREIVFVKKDSESPRAIYRVGADGSNEKRVSKGSASYVGPSFSPQSR